MPKRIFNFTITYFKPSGKYYAHETDVMWAILDCGSEPVSGGDPDVLGPPSAFMPDAAAKVRGLRDYGGPGALPGLSSDGWEGPILLTCEDGAPVLILK